jgi:hypothetical protein
MSEIRPGFHPAVDLGKSSNTAIEIRLIRKIAEEFFVTNGGGPITFGQNVTYRYILVKPTDKFKEGFNLDREIIVIFSDYPDVQPRMLDAIDRAHQMFPDLRLEKICTIIFSSDPKCEAKIRDLLKSDKESQIIIPVGYQEYLLSKDICFMENKFRANFYSRDLYAFQSPLKKDLYFFGRTDIIQKIVNRHTSNENSALFGLRKTGKTSVIFKVERTLEMAGQKSIWIDCLNTSFNKRRWNEALYYIIHLVREKYKREIDDYATKIRANRLKFKPEDQYTEKDAAIIFEDEILRLYAIFDNKSILLIFDEIERITYGVGENSHWASGLDFIFFWQALRSIFQKLNNVFSYLIVGTNPKCVEEALVNGKDNPLFNSVPSTYIERFALPQVKEMVGSLGKFMGLVFDDVVYSKLYEDFGGHPFLIRYVCSSINGIVRSQRPYYIDRTTYETGKAKFIETSSGYFDLMLGILREYYPDEYIMLANLATGNIAEFQEFAELSPEYTQHLLGYGIISKTNGTYDFKIDSIKNYLSTKNRYAKLNQTPEEMHRETEERRNKLEPKLRSLIRIILKAKYGEPEAKKLVLQLFPTEARPKIDSLTVSELLSGDSNKLLMFLHLKEIIYKNWSDFQFIFDKDQKGFDFRMEIVNTIGRRDAHFRSITADEMQEYRTSIGWLETKIKEYES